MLQALQYIYHVLQYIFHVLQYISQALQYLSQGLQHTLQALGRDFGCAFENFKGISNSLRGGMTKRGQKKGKPVRLPLMCQNLMVRSAPKWRGDPSCV